MTRLQCRLKRFAVVALAVIIFAVTCSCLLTIGVSAVSVREYNSAEDIDYTMGEGAKTVLTHKKDEKTTAQYEISDSRITRNATVWMSMSVKFDNPWSWGIRLRNVTCNVKDKTVTGDLVFRFFAKSGVAQVNDVNVGIEKWASYCDIGDNNWHKLVICSSVDNISVWIDGAKAKGTYFSKDVSEMTSNYVCPQIFMAGYNSGTIKDICIWNDGSKENPVMPADKVVKAITSLPDAAAITKTDYIKISETKKAYDNLSATEKKFVTNYGRLEQVLLAFESEKAKKYSLYVSGSKSGKFDSLFPNGSITHKSGDEAIKYYFGGELSRNSEYYIQFSVDFSKAHCFDVYLRNQEHTVNGKKVSGMISMRMFDAGAVVLDSKDNHLSDYINYKSGLMSGVHTVTVRSAPDSCSFWIDGERYDFAEYLVSNGQSSASVTEYSCIEAITGFSLGNSEEWGAFGTIGNIKVWNDGDNSSSGQNRYSIGDEARITVSELPELNQISLSDKDKVQYARSVYDKLSKEDKKYVTNYEKLEKCERAIEFIEEKGDYAYMFLHDDMPEISKESLNLVPSGKINVPVQYNEAYTFNRGTNDLSFLVSDQYINASFENLKGISAEDTYVIKFTYTPHEYYYETPSASWMGLRITFADYSVGGNGQTWKNKNQFAFMVKEGGIITVVNNTTLPLNSSGKISIETNKKYDVVMLCSKGKLKVWVNGRTVAYFDNLAEYGPALEFESSRCKCDITNIQLYNLIDEEPKGITDGTESAMKIIGDILYDEEGNINTDNIEKQKLIFTVIIAVSVIIITVLVCVILIYARKKRNFSVLKKAKENSDI